MVGGGIENWVSCLVPSRLDWAGQSWQVFLLPKGAFIYQGVDMRIQPTNNRMFDQIFSKKIKKDPYFGTAAVAKKYALGSNGGFNAQESGRLDKYVVNQDIYLLNLNVRPNLAALYARLKTETDDLDEDDNFITFAYGYPGKLMRYSDLKTDLEFSLWFCAQFAGSPILGMASTTLPDESGELFDPELMICQEMHFSTGQEEEQRDRVLTLVSSKTFPFT
jgi:hypothetical protein